MAKSLVLFLVYDKLTVHTKKLDFFMLGSYQASRKKKKNVCTHVDGYATIRKAIAPVYIFLALGLGPLFQIVISHLF